MAKTGRPGAPWAADKTAREVRLGLTPEQAVVVDDLAQRAGRLKGSILRQAMDLGLREMRRAANDYKA